ncbi:hypothetical protein MNV49_000235 [Pseudohyphozyma bogoriensis]|nr:hypothetical protein MNV49_000235 [Pseudohyphozyma bogoriensis]
MPLFAKWTPLPHQLPNLSSHSLAVIADKAYLFGGELKPRTPVGPEVRVLGLKDGSVRTLSPPSTTTLWPAARVGSSLASIPSTNSLYVWGGRGGKAMKAFDGDEEDLWKFDASKEEWDAIKTEKSVEGEEPERRSYHVLVAGADEKSLYLHAGCPASGRLAALHSLSLTTSTPTWSTLPTAPSPPRGGTVLTPVPDTPLLARFGGFAGYELGGLDFFDTEKGEWVDVGDESEAKFEGKKVVAVMCLGEREGAPAELGHDGAGFFHSDAWALLASPSGTSPKDTYSWLALPPSSSSSSTPQARGWFASAKWGDEKVVVHGGLNEKNERLSDAWVLEVVEEN